MRIKNSMKNIYISLVTQVVIVLLGFLSRKVFIDNLGAEYLGVNGLLTNILSMLSLVEGGIGASIVYNLYKPLAENNIEETTALVQLYKKLYLILAIIVTLISIFIYPLLGYIMKDGTNVPFIGIVYSIFVFKNVVSYLNAHKWSLINADQKGYVIAKYNLIFNVLITISKIIILKLTKNYILFLLIEVFIFIIQNLYNGFIVNSRYPYIKENKKYKISKDVKSNIIKNVKAMFLHNIGSFCVFGTDNLLISAFINVKTVGLYSNYTMITTQLSALLTPILNGIGASVGNLIATESKEKTYEVFEIVYLVNFWIYSVCTIILYNLLEPFINCWLGRGLLLDKLTFFIILVNFYIGGLRNSIGTFKVRAGMFSEDKYIPLIESIVNLGSSIILVKYFGLAGIFMGTTISTIFLPLWTQSKIVYNKLFDKSVIVYFRKYIFYVILTILTGLVTTNICNMVMLGNEFIKLIVKGIICIVIPNIIYIFVFMRTKEFKYIFNIIKSIFTKVKEKLVLN